MKTKTSTAAEAFLRIDEGVARIVDGADRGRSFRIGGEPLVIGSGRGAGAVLRDSRVSRRHCQVTLTPYGFQVRDLDSRNGTWFEGSRVGDVTVPPGAILKLGRTHLALGAAADAATLEPSRATCFGALIGRSVVMRRIFTLLERAAATDATVLLGGESGTGKELAARGIHLAGARRRGPFEILDLAGVAPPLLASELFGHERGAFTGAANARAGVFERAHGGTLFLDEIGDLPLELQPALLRVVDSGTVTRLGSNAPLAADVRIVAATRRELAEEVVAGRFREDLYYRLQILPIVLPPLRARREDLPLLIDALLRELGVASPGAIAGPSLQPLLEHPFRGNVRELRNVLQRALALAGGPAPFAELALDLDADGGREEGSFQAQKREVVDRFERDYLRDLMDANDGNIKQAARASGMDRTQLKRLLRRHGLI